MGELTRKGVFRLMTVNDLTVNDRAQSMQGLQELPVLQRANKPDEYLFVAMFDGTGQDADNPSQELTNVGVLRDQLRTLSKDSELRVGYGYVEGIGTQVNPFIRGPDMALAFTWDEKIEDAYRQLATQTRLWQEQNPDAQVRVVNVGYSRGAVLSAGLARLIDDYGILDPESLHFGRDVNGNITVHSERPPLMTPGSVAQAAGLYDPVATGFPERYDARLPPSVISRLTLTARDEDRRDFEQQTIVEPGLSEDRRFANLLFAGGHSNIGGGNRDPGAEAMAFNTMADYLNGLRDEPIFKYRPLPTDLSQYTVFQARGPSAMRGMDEDALRDLRPELASCKVVDPCRGGEPIDEALASQFQYRVVQPTAPRPQLPGLSVGTALAPETGPPSPARPAQLLPTDPAHSDHILLRKLDAGIDRLDQQAGKTRDDASDRLSAAALVMAKEMGFTAQDDLQLTFNQPAGRHAAGSILHLSRRGADASPDPAANRVHMLTSDALSMPPADRFRQIDSIDQALQMNRQQELQQAQSRDHGAQMQTTPMTR